MDLVAFLGATLLAICSFPQVIKTVRTKTARDVSWAFLLMWLGGEILIMIHTIKNLDSDIYLMANYICNVVGITIILYYKTQEELWGKLKSKSKSLK